MSTEISDLKNNAMDLIHLDSLINIPLVRGEKGDMGDKGEKGDKRRCQLFADRNSGQRRGG